mmetsp:Transcript_8888/g.23218  ORF Transcript_8888/g.23218 Transcript_8888/m.23218 type:complete len:421 (-) Transcript_8888:8-1270(-)
MAQAAGAGALHAHRQACAGDGDPEVSARRRRLHAAGGGGDGGRHQRRARPQAGGRGVRHVHQRHAGGAAGGRHCHPRRQLPEHRRRCQVGPLRLRQHLQVPPVPAHRKHHRVPHRRRGRGRADRVAPQGHPAALGQPDHGLFRLPRPGHRGPHQLPPHAQALPAGPGGPLPDHGAQHGAALRVAAHRPHRPDLRHRGRLRGARGRMHGDRIHQQLRLASERQARRLRLQRRPGPVPPCLRPQGQQHLRRRHRGAVAVRGLLQRGARGGGGEDAALHHGIQRVCAHAALQRDQQQEDSQRAQRPRGGAQELLLSHHRRRHAHRADWVDRDPRRKHRVWVHQPHPGPVGGVPPPRGVGDSPQCALPPCPGIHVPLRRGGDPGRGRRGWGRQEGRRREEERLRSRALPRALLREPLGRDLLPS